MGDRAKARYNQRMSNEMPPDDPGLAGAGKHVKITLITRRDEREEMEFEIVPDAYADFAHGYLGEGTPLAKAIRGKPAGSRVPYRVGDEQAIMIEAVEPARSLPPKEVAARRQAVLDKAIQDSDRTNAMIFASSFSGKWGDYDPKGIEGWEMGPEENGGEEEQTDEKPGAPTVDSSSSMK